MANFLFALICVSGVSLSLGGSYNYIKNDADGPSNWGGKCASGTKQSPIDINSTTAKYMSFDAWNLENYAAVQAVNFTGTNTGGTLKISVPTNLYFVNGGGLQGNFTTAQMHLHWGSSNSKGSEHFVDGKQYAAEIHFVSYNVKYSSLTEAVNKSDGLAVLGVLIGVGTANSAYSSIFSNAAKLVNESSTVEDIAGFNLNNLLPAKKTEFYRYNGSLTTPTCDESVQWTVFSNPIEISAAQMTSLRNLMMNSSMSLADNFRPTQAIGSRKVYVSFQAPTTAPGTAPVPTEAESASAVTKITTGLLLLMFFAALFFN
ncbi:hypothetical protein ACROYT_G010378 [Oculina patagonica]